MKSTVFSVYKIVSLCLMVFAISINITAQDLDEVTISGKITDTNGDPVIGAKVLITNVSTGIKRNVVTKANGRYRLIELSPGKYKLKVTAKGFADKLTDELNTLSGQTITLNFKLSPASVVAEQTVTISEDDVSTIDITRTVVGGTITEQEIQELPNTSNDVLDLVFTLGGTAEEPLSIRNLASDDRIGGGSESDQPSSIIGTGSVSLAGGAANSTNITIDGLDNNDDRTASERFQPSIDSIAEVQVITNQFSAEYGRASGGRINIRTKAGARKLRGRFSMFFEDESLNANTYNNNRRGISRLPFTEYEPGGTLGGPIPLGYFKDKTFFFSSYSYRDRDSSSLIFTALPVDQNPLFSLPTPTNPELTRPNLEDGDSALIASFITTVGTPQRRHRFTQRIDHNFTDTHNITFNYQLGRSDGFRQFRETTRFLPETLQGRIRDNDSFYITDNYVVNSNFVNQFRFQYSNYRPDFSTNSPNAPVVLLRITDDFIPGDGSTFPNILDDDRTSGTVVIGNSTANFANTRNETRYQFQETANFVIGDFNLRIGADIQNIRSRTTELLDTTGTFRFDDFGSDRDNVNAFLNNQLTRYQRNSDSISTIENTYAGFFVQTDWRFRSNITLSAGLRYERENLISDNNNFAPRLAAAYSPGDDGKSVFRIGAGIFYNRVLLRTVDDAILLPNRESFDSNRLSGTSNETSCHDPASSNFTTDECVFLRFASQQFPNPLTLEEIRQVPGIEDIERGFSSLEFSRRLEDNIKIPESYQFNVGYERDLGKNFAFEVNYTYNKGVRLWRERNINAISVPEGFANFTEFLLSLGDIEIPGTSSGTDIYRFVLGDPTDTNGDMPLDNPDGDCISSTPICVVNLNTLNPSTSTLEPIGISRRVILDQLGSPIPGAGLDQIEEVGSMGRSVYHGLQFELRRRFRNLGRGFSSSMRISYVLSRTRDDGFVDTSSAQVAGDFNSEFSRSLIDRLHKFRFTGTIETPRWFGKLRFSPLLRVESGRPFNVSIGGADRNLDNVRNDRPNFTGDPSDIIYREPNDPPLTALAEQFSLAPIGSTGNLIRNAGNGPALFIFDLNVSRRFNFTERIRLRPQISFDNILNATVFSFGSDFINLATAGTSEFEQGFLTPSRTLRQRRIQLGLRFEF